MNKIDEAWQALKKLPPEEQERMAEAILDFAAQTSDIHLTDEQLEEVRRRQAVKDPVILSEKEAESRIANLLK